MTRTIAFGVLVLASGLFTCDPTYGQRIRLETQSGRIEDFRISPNGEYFVDLGSKAIIHAATGKRIGRVPSQGIGLSAVEFSPKGDWLLTIEDGTASIWALPSLTQAAVLEGSFQSATLSPNGTMIALVDLDGTVVLTDRELRPREIDSRASSVAFSPLGDQLLMCHEDRTSVATIEGKVLWTENSGANFAKYSPDGSLVLIGRPDSFHVLSASDGKPLAHLERVGGDFDDTVHAKWVSSTLIACSLTEGLALWNVGTGTVQQLRTDTGHAQKIQQIDVSPTGEYVTALAFDVLTVNRTKSFLRVWETSTGRCVLSTDEGEFASDCAFDPLGRGLWLATDSTNLHLFSLGTWRRSVYDVSRIQPLKLAIRCGPSDLLFGNEVSLWKMRADGTITWRTDADNETDPPVLSPREDRLLTFAYRKTTATGTDEMEIDDTQAAEEGDVEADEEPEPQENVHPFVNQRPRPINLRMMVDGTIVRGFDQSLDAQFSSDGRLVAVQDVSGVEIYDAETGQYVWEVPGSNGGFCWDVDPTHVFAFAAEEDQSKVRRYRIGQSSPDSTIHFGSPVTGIASRAGLLAAQTQSESTLSLEVRRVDTGALLYRLEAEPGMGSPELHPVAFSATGDNLFWFGELTCMFPVRAGALGQRLTLDAPLLSADLSHLIADDQRLALPQWDPLCIEIVDTQTGASKLTISSPEEILSTAWFGDRLVTLDEFGMLSVWDAATGASLGSLAFDKDGGWLAFDSSGRYDASDPSHVSCAHYVFEHEQGLEPVAHSQLREHFYDPGLRARMLGLEPGIPRDVPNLDTLRLYPEVSLTATSRTSFSAEVREQDSGGVGILTVQLNGKQVIRKRASGFEEFDLSQFENWFLPANELPAGRGNRVTVSVTNRAGDLKSPEYELDLGVPPNLEAPNTRLLALFVGVGDYPGTARDLDAPPNDVHALARALETSANRLLNGQTSITTLTTDLPDRPTRARIAAWFEMARRARSTDIIFVYFSGHATSLVGDQRDYFYLTSEADPLDLTASAIGRSTVTGEDLRTWLNAIPANKQVVVLDTCHAGLATDAVLGLGRGGSADYVRAFEDIRHSTGSWVLASCAGDQSSFESERVKHGLLTYGLLEAIDRASSDGLRPDSSGGRFYIDVDRWLTYAADRVASLRNEVGITQSQRPLVRRANSTSSFPLGFVTAEERGQVGLQPPVPVLLLGPFDQNKEDPLNLEPLIADELTRLERILVRPDTSRHPNTYRVTGEYTAVGTTVSLTIYLQRLGSNSERINLAVFKVEGPTEDLPKLLRSELQRRIAEEESRRAPLLEPDRE